MTIYYIDSDNGSDSNPGTSAGSAWATLSKFTSSSRTVGDVAAVRRNRTAAIQTGSFSCLTSGLLANMIKVEGDYDDAWGDHLDVSGTATATLTWGSKTVAFTADVSSLIAAGDWIYVQEDDIRSHAYLVASVSGSTVTLMFAYLGENAGSGKVIKNMKAAPVIGAGTADTSTLFSIGVGNWVFQGLNIKTNRASGAISFTGSNHSIFFKDIEYTTGTNTGIVFLTNGLNDDFGWVYLNKIYIKGATLAKARFLGMSIYATNLVIDANNKTSNAGTPFNADELFFKAENVEIKNVVNSNQFSISALGKTEYRIRNLLYSGTLTPNVNYSFDNIADAVVALEDVNGAAGVSKVWVLNGQIGDSIPAIQTDTSILRSGGSAVSIKINPKTTLTPNSPPGFLTILDELPFYVAATQTSFTIYIKPNATNDWTANPLATELYLEASYYHSASTAYRRHLRSTGIIDMKGNSGWQALTISITPAQAGLVYLSLKYGKTRESGKNNTFFVDPLPLPS